MGPGDPSTRAGVGCGLALGGRVVGSRRQACGERSGKEQTSVEYAGQVLKEDACGVGRLIARFFGQGACGMPGSADASEHGPLAWGGHGGGIIPGRRSSRR